MRLLSLLSLSLAACTGKAGDPGISLSVSPRSGNALIADAAVTLPEAGDVRIELWSDEVGPLQTAVSAGGTAHAIAVVGMRAESVYQLRAVATLADGTALESEVVEFETGELPEGIPSLAVSGGLSPAEITIIGPATGSGGGAPPPAEAALGPFLIGVDGEGEVVWYYDPGDIEGADTRNRSAEPLPGGGLMLMLPRELRLITADGRTERSLRNQGLPADEIHHDAEVLPSGNLVLLGAETRTISAAPFPGEIDVSGDVLLELDEDGEVVWEWSAFDHLDTDRWPTELSMTTAATDGALQWTHANSVAYDASSDSLVVSLRHQSWVISVDRASGEVNWRLGEEGDFDLLSGEWFSAQHAATMPAADEVLLYDNGNEKEPPRSRAVAYRIDPASGAADQIWSWDPQTYTSNQGDADRLPGGDTLVCVGGERRDGDARIVQVTPEGDVVWELSVGDDSWIYRAARVEWLTEVE